MPIDELKDKYLQKIPELSWYLVRTMPRSERHAEVFFQTNEIPCYLPRYRKIYINSFDGKNGKKYAYSRQAAPAPIFPGYIFAALNADFTTQTRMNRHIAQVCLYTNYTEDELLADLHAVQEFEFLAKNNPIEVGENVQKGKSIVIKRGIFKGWEGIVERRFNRNFVFVRLQTLGSSIGIECAVADCEVLD